MNRHKVDSRKSDEIHLNIAAYVIDTSVLGPCHRSVVWVQGCPFRCKGCIAPDWIPQIPSRLVIPEELAETLIANPVITGITISGGEPMLQALALSRMVYAAKAIRDIDIICFTGFRYESLVNDNRLAGVAEFLRTIDLLIDGQYVEGKNENIGMRGSSNQRFIHLTNKLTHHPFDNQPRNIEFHISDGELLSVGIPPRNSFRLSDQRFNFSGIDLMR
jgi:anaerobic ribonucleoside-triphosphate reductase activating protein